MSGPETGAGIYFRYVACKDGKPSGPALDRSDAVERLRNRAGDVTVWVYPSPSGVEVRAGQGLRGDPQVQASGWGYVDPKRATRLSQALAEAAAVAEEATR